MVAKQVPFTIKSGLPFAKTVVATLPNGRAWWTDDTQFEILCQIREDNDVESELILDLAQFITYEIDDLVDADVVNIELAMNGEDTRKVTRSGYYDMVISDPFATDGRAFVLIAGKVNRESLVSAGVEETD